MAQTGEAAGVAAAMAAAKNVPPIDLDAEQAVARLREIPAETPP